MSKREVDEIAKYLYWEWREGAQIVTWNGLGFDFDVMHEECRWWKSSLRFMAWNHIDPGFQMLCEKGFMVGLDTAAKGMGLHGKTEGMSGKDAPVMWAEGRNQQEKVLEYVAQDAVTTLEVYEAILRRGSLSWISRSGRANKWRPEFKNGRMLTAKECMHIPEPDTSWMSDPWPRKKFYGWLDPLK
jgi:predicted PolB exonuclease-like 3'-5' exonuclease